jgi:hypothetical protein
MAKAAVPVAASILCSNKEVQMRSFAGRDILSLKDFERNEFSTCSTGGNRADRPVAQERDMLKRRPW